MELTLQIEDRDNKQATASPELQRIISFTGHQNELSFLENNDRPSLNSSTEIILTCKFYLFWFYVLKSQEKITQLFFLPFLTPFCVLLTSITPCFSLLKIFDSPGERPNCEIQAVLSSNTRTHYFCQWPQNENFKQLFWKYSSI